MCFSVIQMQWVHAVQIMRIRNDIWPFDMLVYNILYRMENFILFSLPGVCVWTEIMAWPIIQCIKKSDCGVKSQKCDAWLKCAFLQKVPAGCLEGSISLKGEFTKKLQPEEKSINTGQWEVKGEFTEHSIFQ